mmetsp:Transcript_17265/g.31360  ORF Transcript_17265/g.31360 Transcript_17265/m.31360 type:complete len:111 (+) Transcript_17265:212-544(+)
MSRSNPPTPSQIYCHADFYSVVSAAETLVGVVTTLGLAGFCYFKVYSTITRVVGNTKGGGKNERVMSKAELTALRLMYFWLFCVCMWTPCVLQLFGKLFRIQTADYGVSM